MNLDEKAFQTHVVRPLVALWAVMAVGLVAAVMVDALAPKGSSPVAGFFNYRSNTASAEWAAAAEARSQIRHGTAPGPAVVVDTDNGIFFYLLRYQLYPAWVMRAEWLTPAGSAQADPLIAEHFGGVAYLVDYTKGYLAVTRVQP